jgi:hypothetical protein
MAQLSLGENRWRMLRRVVRKKRFRYEDARNQARPDRQHFDWLVDNEFLTQVGDGVYELTERGRAAADLGEYEMRPTDTELPKFDARRR